MQVIKILLVDDHPAIVRGMERMLSKHPDMDVVGSAGCGRDALALAAELRPDVILLDYSLPDLSGAEATRLAIERLSGVKVIGYSHFDDYETVASFFRAGAHGFVEKSAGEDDLCKAIRNATTGRISTPQDRSSVHSSQAACQHNRAALVLQKTPQLHSEAPCWLTKREREVLKFTADGMTAKEVAAELGISRRTAEFHLGRIKRKLNIDRTAQLVKYAIRTGLSSL